MRNLGLLLLGCLMAAVASSQTTGPLSATVAWTAPTANTDGSALTGALTYNLYQGAAGAMVSVQTGLTTVSATVTKGLTAGSTQCFAITAVENGVESLQSLPACVTLQALTPTAPGIPTVTIT